jgi:hypothetical protein
LLVFLSFQSQSNLLDTSVKCWIQISLNNEPNKDKNNQTSDCISCNNMNDKMKCCTFLSFTLSFEIQLMKTCFIRNIFSKNLTVNVKNNVISHIAVQPCAVICTIGFVLSKRSKNPWKRSNSCDFKGYWNNWCDLCHVTTKSHFDYYDILWQSKTVGFRYHRCIWKDLQDQW